MGMVVGVAKELKRVDLPAELQFAVMTIESALAESGYMGFFDITGGAAHIDTFYFNGELHTQERNEWYVRKEVV